jgi:hypothetical protein
MDRLLLATAGIQRLIDEPTRDDDSDEAEIIKRPKSVNLRRIELWRQMILTGLEEEPASLALIEGIGPKWAQKLCAYGIKNLDSLGIANSDELGSLPGLSPKRAAEWIARAQIIAADVLPKMTAPRLRITPIEAECPVDPYRLRRSLDLQCVSRGRHAWIVSGGLEPHQVQQTKAQWQCDCTDFAKGHLCKHILKVRHSKGDPILTAAINRMQGPASSEWLDLFSLWFER